MFDGVQMKQLVELISVTAAALVQQQQAAAAVTTTSPAPKRMTPATTLSSNDGSRLMMELRKFSGEEADWDKWHKMYSSQTMILGLAKELVATDEILDGAEDFNIQDIDPL